MNVPKSMADAAGPEAAERLSRLDAEAVAWEVAGLNGIEIVHWVTPSLVLEEWAESCAEGDPEPDEAEVAQAVRDAADSIDTDEVWVELAVRDALRRLGHDID